MRVFQAAQLNHYVINEFSFFVMPLQYHTVYMSTKLLHQSHYVTPLPVFASSHHSNYESNLVCCNIKITPW